MVNFYRFPYMIKCNTLDLLCFLALSMYLLHTFEAEVQVILPQVNLAETIPAYLANNDS